MTVRDAEPGDIYVDSVGKLWRTVGIISEPSITFEEIETSKGVPTTSRHKIRITGGVSGLMWNGFDRIYRQTMEAKPDAPR